MKINISRQNIYLLVLSIMLLVFVLLFSFFVLIPAGKDYREERTKVNHEMKELRRYQEFNSATLEQLKTLQADNRDIITAFDTSFNPDKFAKQYRVHFTSLHLSKHEKMIDGAEDEFAVYEVNTTSAINSPQSFYDFLDAINKSTWVIGVNFPINFKRDREMIKASFTMKVYNAQKIVQK